METQQQEPTEILKNLLTVASGCEKMGTVHRETGEYLVREILNLWRTMNEDGWVFYQP